MLKIEKTIYDPKEAQDGERILVMHLWPRGISKSAVDLWFKELGCDHDLIHDWKEGKISWQQFSKRYLATLNGKEALLDQLVQKAKNGTVTLLCSCKDANHCHRFLLKAELEMRSK
jgi:uncharacterized protein YeaO (DUF488 family)